MRPAWHGRGYDARARRNCLLTPLALSALVLAGMVAAGDWAAVQRANRPLEYACKPGTMVLLLIAALLLRPLSGAERAWFVAALALGLVGDVFLMLPGDRFLQGLLSFLLGHLAFIVGFVLGGTNLLRGVLALVGAAGLAAAMLPQVLRGVRERGNPAMIPAVIAYVTVISLMMATAFASRQPLAVVPAVLFFTSDALIAFRRFVASRPWMSLAVIVTYHLAQAGLVVWLVL